MIKVIDAQSCNHHLLGAHIVKVDTVIALAVASLVCIGLMALVGISSDGTPSATSGFFGALAELAKQVLGN